MHIINNVMGQIVTINYSIDIEYNNDGEIIRKPQYKKERLVEYKKILSFNGTNIRGNNSISYEINIAPDKTIVIEKELFMADSGEMYLYSNHIIEENEQWGNAPKQMNKLIKEYNAQQIKKDSKLLSYCKVHNLVVEETDVDELRQIVYPDIICCGEQIRHILSNAYNNLIIPQFTSQFNQVTIL